jgi:hypothetical protein
MKTFLYFFLMTPFFLLGQDYSISFDGESYIETLYPGPLGDSPRTLCYWAKFIDNSEVGTFSYGSSSFGTDFISFHNWNATGDEPCIGPSFTMTGAGITYDDISASDYDWHHFAFVLNGESNQNDAVTIYVDGNELTNVCSDANYGASINTGSVNPINIGRAFSPNHSFIASMKGQLNNVALWDYALSSNQIQSYMIIPPNSEDEGLVGYWDFNEGSGDTVYDISDNENHGLIHGAEYSYILTNVDGLGEIYYAGAYNNSYYYFTSGNTFDWATANENVTALNASLLDINVQDEINFISPHLYDGFNYWISNNQLINASGDLVSGGGQHDIIIESPSLLSMHPSSVLIGCIDSTACNYNPEANMSDGSCQYSSPGIDCNNNQIWTQLHNNSCYNIITDGNGTYYSLNDNSVTKSFNVGLTWESTNFPQNPEFGAIATDSIIFVGSPHNDLYSSTDKGVSWESSFSGSWGCAAGRMILMENADEILMSYSGSLRGIYKSNNYSSNNISWGNRFNPTGADCWDMCLSEDNNIVYSAFRSSNHIGGLYQSFDYGDSWELLLQTEYADNPSVLEATDSHIFYVSVDNKFYKSLDEGLTWSNTHIFTDMNGDLAPNYSCKDMVRIGNTIIASFNNIGLFKSEDEGETWEKLDELLENDLNYMLVNDNKLFVSSSSGLYSITYGCTDESACNYNIESNLDDGSCDFAQVGQDCESNVDNFSISFDGNDDYIDLGNIDIISNGIENEYTVSFWLNLSSLEMPDQQVVIFGDEVSQNNGILLQIHEEWGFGAYIAGTDTTYTGYIPPVDVWNYYSVVQNELGIHFYLNGDYHSHITEGLNSETDISTFVGKHQVNTRFLDGELENLSIHNIALNQEEIQSYMTCSIPYESGLIGYWNFNEGIGNIAIDLSGNGNHGSIYDATYLSDVPEDNCSENTNIEIGDEAFGGIVFYVADGVDGQYGLVASSDYIGTGTWQQANEQAVSYEIDQFTDWYLPNMNELSMIYNQLHLSGINEYSTEDINNWYWSSEVCESSLNASDFQFSNGSYNLCNNMSSYQGGIIPIQNFGNVVYGCIDSLACNYNQEANMADATCDYSELGYDCDGNITEYIVGMEVEGGIVFHVNEIDQFGLIVSMEDLSGNYQWGCYQNDVDGADGIELGTGYQNTMDVVNQGCLSEVDGITAAQAALDFISEDGYSDWYLPSNDELIEVYNNVGPGGVLGNIVNLNTSTEDNYVYWTSTENNSSTSFILYPDGQTQWTNKYGNFLVRVIRTLNYYGCTDETAQNFNSLAINDNSSCQYYAGPLWYVSENGSDELSSGSIDDPFASIQNAINISNNGDTIIVASGSYTENINFNGKNISLIGEDKTNTIISADDSSNPIVTFNLNEESYLSGFTINGGENSAINIENASPEISNMIISGNTSFDGGALYISSSSVNISDCIIENNYANDQGGAVYIRSSSNVNLSNVILQNNLANRGGAILITEGSDLLIDNSVLLNNQTHDDYNGGSNPNSGGAIYSVESQIIISNSSVTGNSATADGAGIYVNESSMNLYSIDINDNNSISEGHGGGCSIWNTSDVTISHSNINNNSNGTGGGIYSFNSSLNIEYSSITRNYAEGDGGGITISQSGNASTLLLSSSTLHDNTANTIPQSNGVKLGGDNAIATINNSIIWEKVLGDNFTITYSNIQGQAEDSLEVYAGEGNISALPLFESVAPSNPDYHLTACSPCIDAGNPEENDPDGSIIDMGALPFISQGYDCDGNINVEIGDEAFGGIIFYIDETGQHGLVAAMEDLTVGAINPNNWATNGYEWGCLNEIVDGADGIAIGNGYQNTIDVITQNCQTQNGGITASQAALSLETEGYSDWYLPSKDELYSIYNNISQNSPIGNIGNFSDDSYGAYYWSSTEYNSTKAYSLSFNTLDQGYNNKDLPYKVRPIRAFGNWTMGCMDILACNFSTEVNMSNGSCEYPEVGNDCEENHENYSLNFDGQGDYISISPNYILDASITNELTLSSWVNINDTTSLSPIIRYFPEDLFSPVSGEPALQYSMYINNGKIYFVAGPGNVNDNQFEQGSGNIGNSSIYSNQWHYVTITYDQQSIKFYIDGILDYERSIIADFDINSGGELIIGSEISQQWEFNGGIDNVEIWNAPLSQEQIQSYMICPPSGEEEGLVGYWDFNEGVGDIVYDITENGNNGVIIGGAIYNQDVPENNCLENNLISLCIDSLADNYNPYADPIHGFYVGAENISLYGWIVDNSYCEYFYGCTDPTAINFTVDATIDDDSCIALEDAYVGCMDDNYLEFDENVNINNDNFCLTLLYSGCTDVNACNFEADATDDNGTCFYAQSYYDCFGGCLNDTDSDGVCDELEIAGCTDITACNFETDATDDNGTCFYAQTYYDCFGGCLNDTDSDGVCDELEIYGCTDNIACNFDISATEEDGTCINAQIYYNCLGECLNDLDSDGVCDELEIAGCTDVIACNFEDDATDDNGTCFYAQTYYDCFEECLNDTDLDGVCDELEIAGCTDITACNFEDDATDDNGTCFYAQTYYDCFGECLNDTDSDGVCDELEIAGCTNPVACNFDTEATEEDFSCFYPELYLDCDNNCINDFDLDQVCDEVDNCWNEYNPDQEDLDNDDLGDECDDEIEIGIDELSSESQILTKMIDILGREQKEHKKGTLLFYIYDNGMVEKKFNP